MVNFIVCDDNKEVCKNVLDLISRVMMKNKLRYKTFSFNDYDSGFMDLMQKSIPNKIYILDIETPIMSGIDIARKIRETDVNSIIIFLTSHNEVGSILLQDELMFLTFICKFNDQERRLESAIQKSLKMIGSKQAIKFEDKGAIYTIALNDILYVTYDSVERKSILVTEEGNYKINKSLIELSEMLDGRFEQTHRACFTNMDRVRVIDKKNNIIMFDNGFQINLLSKNYKKELHLCTD